jgi:hypothetical protein
LRRRARLRPVRTLHRSTNRHSCARFQLTRG